jgi:hypothetical protein
MVATVAFVSMWLSHTITLRMRIPEMTPPSPPTVYSFSCIYSVLLSRPTFDREASEQVASWIESCAVRDWAFA